MPRARVFAIVTIAAALSAGPAHAATLTVTTTADETIAGDRACSLREAIAAVDSPGTANGDCAAAAFGPNTIVLGPQTYSLGLAGTGGQMTIASNVTLTLTGAGEDRTTIDARALQDRVFEIAAGATVTINDLTITGGHAPGGAPGSSGSSGAAGDGAPGADGGAILNQGSLTIVNVGVTNSRAGDGGAASPPATDGSGQPGHNGGAGGAGGAIFNTGSLTLTGATIAGNHAGAGGAGGNGGTANSSGGGHGGSGGAGGSGGGIANPGGTLTISGSALSGNVAGDGGAGGAGGTSGADVGGAGGNGGAGGSGGGVWSAGGSLSVTNGTLASNTSGSGAAGGNGGQGAPTGGAGGNGGDNGTGGGVAVGTAGAGLLNLTIVGNGVGQAGAAGAGGPGTTAGAGGAAGSAGGAGGASGTGTALALQNTLLALNKSGNCGGSITDSGHDLSFGGTGCPATFIGGDPVLGPLQDNGGPSPTISLGIGSAAIDKIPSTGAGCPATDQRGVKRPAGSECDIGAYELAPPKIGTVSVTDVGKTTATVNALVTPNAGTASVEFDYGTTNKYGSKSVKSAAGVAASVISAKLSRLRARTTYHLRVVVTATDGTVTSADRTFATSPAPIVSKLKIKPSAFRAGGRGATITYTDSLAANVTFVVLRRAPGGKRFVRVGSFTHKDTAGANSVRFNGRLRSGKLARGSYRLELTGRANGRASRTVATTFRITG